MHKQSFGRGSGSLIQSRILERVRATRFQRICFMIGQKPSCDYRAPCCGPTCVPSRRYSLCYNATNISSCIECFLIKRHFDEIFRVTTFINMPCCAAWGCSNRKNRGKQIHRFPRNPERRKIWEVKVRRDGWKANDNCLLCEVRST